MFFFDLDGTLIDSNGIWKDVDREFLARRGLPDTHAYYEGVAHTIFPLAAKFTKEFCHLSESCEEIMAEWMELAKDLYAHVAIKPGVRAYLKQCKNAVSYTHLERLSAQTQSVDYRRRRCQLRHRLRLSLIHISGAWLQEHKGGICAWRQQGYGGSCARRRATGAQTPDCARNGPDCS